MHDTLNRKYLMQAIEGSLERFGLDFVDLVLLPPGRPGTPVEETVWAMSDIVSAGRALYWGTSEWPAESSGRLGTSPSATTCTRRSSSSLSTTFLTRRRVEVEYAALRRHRPRAHHLEPPGVGPSDRQVPRRGTQRLAGHGPRLRGAAPGGDRPHTQRSGGPPGQGGRRPGLQPLAAGDRLVRPQPARLECHHRSQPGRAGPGEHGRARGHTSARRGRRSPGGGGDRRRRGLTGLAGSNTFWSRVGAARAAGSRRPNYGRAGCKLKQRSSGVKRGVERRAHRARPSKGGRSARKARRLGYVPLGRAPADRRPWRRVPDHRRPRGRRRGGKSVPASPGSQPGDHVVFGFVPACGYCPSCARGRSNLCDNGAAL